MATELIATTWCDKHMKDDDARREASEAARVAVDGRPYTLDLCPECAEQFQPLIDFVTTYGQPADAAPMGRPPRAATYDATAGGYACSICSSRPSSAGALRTHYRKVHGMSARDYAGFLPNSHVSPGTVQPCPDCSFVAANGTGLAAHRRAAHGRGTVA